jgi:hypothetical protein
MKRKNKRRTVRWRGRFKEQDYDVCRRKAVDGGGNKLGLKGLQNHFKISVMNTQIIFT